MNYQDKKIAVFGASEDPSKYGYKILTELSANGIDVYGINPKGGHIKGHTFFACLADIPVQIDAAIMVVPPAALAGAVAQCIKSGVREIWFQPGARSESAYQAAQAAGINAVNGCFMIENGFW
ncbi:MAG: CoA-binding protein [Elusimicrobiaceae bacterium]|nr:CoA-binding protein [Elusimicrobiaceae bacterium]